MLAIEIDEEDRAMRIGNLSGRLTLFSDQGAIDVEQASGGQFGADPQVVYQRWAEFTEWAATNTAEGVPYAVADLGPPAPRPSQVFALAINYRDHASEGGADVPNSPMVFSKFVSSFNGPTGEIVLAGPTVDWEVELVAVIGKRAYKVPVEQGWDHVAGLTIGQDISERTVQQRGPMPQFCLGKSFPGFSPSGPWLVTADEFTDPDNLELSCSVNGRTMQKARTADLVFPIPALVAELSSVLPLEPGDVIFTGTPAGVGMARKPPLFLAVGDELVTTIESIGEMRHTFVSA
jgi:2-keto-4-pentenoate hydratase/2-oxohepta-3-ene-1,7-dioic acid hydratase in catechol pathway